MVNSRRGPRRTIHRDAAARTQGDADGAGGEGESGLERIHAQDALEVEGEEEHRRGQSPADECREAVCDGDRADPEHVKRDDGVSGPALEVG